MTTITLRLPDELDAALERQCAVRGVSKSDLVRDALRRFLAVSELQDSRANFVGRAQTQGVHTDEDVFRRLDGK